MKIALVQLHIDHKNKSNNWTRVEDYMVKAAKQKVDLIVFPEFFLGGPGRSSSLKNATERLGALARKYQMDLVPGTIVEHDEEQNVYRNTAYYIDYTGRVLLKYDKVHLWQHERSYLTQGEFEFNTVKNRFGVTIGLCACWDLSVPEVFRELAMNGDAQLIIIPAYWTLSEVDDTKCDLESEYKLLQGLLTARAFENLTCVAFCNAARRLPHGNNEELLRKQERRFGIVSGASQIVVPFKGTVACIDSDQEDMLIHDLPVVPIVHDADKEFKIRSEWHKHRIFPGRGFSSSSSYLDAKL
ncbi:carbon-nitrogen hydrolase [Halteromyces radiatus]|uniref:carbon-nitrogen hydrolase n=1 Tax=Halteromyces radiatus TaxID=101107 RepID=UPI00221F4DEC|nr:carbon-nitrogen hydrolase [Halteromyces radiatus]KAI8089212.1 carbon-nitrogen hydrolase [Halteromyces radiatus]